MTVVQTRAAILGELQLPLDTLCRHSEQWVTCGHCDDVPAKTLFHNPTRREAGRIVSVRSEVFDACSDRGSYYAGQLEILEERLRVHQHFLSRVFELFVVHGTLSLDDARKLIEEVKVAL